MAIVSQKNQKKKISEMVDKVFIKTYRSLVNQVKAMPSNVISRSVLFAADLHWKAGNEMRAINTLEQYIKAKESEKAQQ